MSTNYDGEAKVRSKLVAIQAEFAAAGKSIDEVQLPFIEFCEVFSEVAERNDILVIAALFTRRQERSFNYVLPLGVVRVSLSDDEKTRVIMEVG